MQRANDGALDAPKAAISEKGRGANFSVAVEETEKQLGTEAGEEDPCPPATGQQVFPPVPCSLAAPPMLGLCSEQDLSTQPGLRF